MNDEDILTFIRMHKWAIEATTSSTFAPQAAIIGIAATNQLELVFDWTASTRMSGKTTFILAGWLGMNVAG